MTKIAFFILTVFFSPWMLYGQTNLVTNPALDYVTSAKFPDDLVPKSDKVLRLSLDLYGNGKPTIFLSFRGFGDRDGNIWTAYTPTTGGYQRVDRTADGNLIQFRPDGFYSSGTIPGYSSKGGLYVLYPGKGAGSLVHYTIKNGEARSEPVRNIDYANDDDKKFIETVLKHKLEDRAKLTEHPSYSVLTVADIKAEANK